MLNFDVSAHVTAPGTYSFIIEADSSTRDVSFASGEGSPTASRPALVVTSAAGSPAAPAVGEPDGKGQAQGAVVAGQVELSRGSGPSGPVASLSLQGAAAFTRYAVERSIDLRDWEVIDAVDTDEFGAAVFDDLAAPDGQAFYRLNDEVPVPVEP